MADLVKDAVCTTGTSTFVNNIASRVTPGILNEMLNDLDEGDIISLIFLMVDENTDFYKVLEEVKKDPRAAVTRFPCMNLWPEKLLESLIIIGNKHVLGRMGFDKKEIQLYENLFVGRQHNVSPYLNKAIKSLYFLCESLDNNDTKILIDKVNKQLGKSSDDNPGNMYLELHILEWLQQKYISINPDQFDLSKLLKSLKSIDCLGDVQFNFDYWEIPGQIDNRNKQDSQMCSRISDNNSSLQYQNNESSISKIDEDIKWSSPDHLKLLIVINETTFTDEEKFKSRKKGSMEDEMNLEKTFTGCGFEIEKHSNLKKQEMIELLETLNSTFKYSRYGTIFMCILSHGYKGEVVFADDECISIDTIRGKFCCKRLQNVFKFLILQACQGEKIGLVQKPFGNLVKDGPSNSMNPLYHKHFCLFHATVPNYAAIRDEKRGSWFIQDLCQQIQEANKQIEISDLIKKVKKALSKRRGNLSNNYFEHAVQVAELAADTTEDAYVLFKIRENQ